MADFTCRHCLLSLAYLPSRHRKSHKNQLTVPALTQFSESRNIDPCLFVIKLNGYCEKSTVIEMSQIIKVTKIESYNLFFFHICILNIQRDRYLFVYFILFSASVHFSEPYQKYIVVCGTIWDVNVKERIVTNSLSSLPSSLSSLSSSLSS